MSRRYGTAKPTRFFANRWHRTSRRRSASPVRSTPARFNTSMVASVKGQVRRSLTVSFIEGLFGSGMLGLVDTCTLPFAIAMNASPSQVANLGSLPNLTAALAQSQANTLTDWLGGRRKTILAAIF